MEKLIYFKYATLKVYRISAESPCVFYNHFLGGLIEMNFYVTIPELSTSQLICSWNDPLADFECFVFFQ